MKFFLSILGALIGLLGMTQQVHAADVVLRAIVNASYSLTDDTSVAYKGILPNLANDTRSFHYLGVRHKVNDWLTTAGIVGATAFPGKDSLILRGDAGFFLEGFTLYNFVEWYAQYESLGVFNDLSYTTDWCGVGVESYTTVDLSLNSKHLYSVGLYVSLPLSEYLTLAPSYVWYGSPMQRMVRITTAISF